MARSVGVIRLVFVAWHSTHSVHRDESLPETAVPHSTWSEAVAPTPLGLIQPVSRPDPALLTAHTGAHIPLLLEALGEGVANIPEVSVGPLHYGKTCVQHTASEMGYKATPCFGGAESSRDSMHTKPG